MTEKKKDRKVSISTYLPQEILKKVEAEADKQFISPSAFIRKIIYSYFSKNE